MDSMVLAATIRGGNASLESFSGTFKTSGRFPKKEDLIAKRLECLKKLNGVDQVILRCWMVYPKREYTDMAIEELGWDDNKRTRNVVNVRCNRAIAMLGKMMGGARSDYRDVYLPSVQKAPDQPSEPIRSINDYNFIRRRQRAARKSVTSGIDYRDLTKSLSSRLPD